jgi:hypothetical protein
MGMLADVCLGRLMYPEAQPPRWGWSLWLDPFAAGQGGRSETKEEAMRDIRRL